MNPLILNKDDQMMTTVRGVLYEHKSGKGESVIRRKRWTSNGRQYSTPVQYSC